MKLAIAADLDQGLYDLKPVRNKFKIVSGPRPDWVGKFVTVSTTKARTMTRARMGWVYDPNGQDVEYTKAVYWQGRSGWSPGIVVDNIDQAREALKNRDLTSVPYYTR